MSDFPPGCLVNWNLPYLFRFFFLRIKVYIVFDIVVVFGKTLLIFLQIKLSNY